MISCSVIGRLSTIQILKSYIEKFPLTTFIGSFEKTLNDFNLVLIGKPQIVFIEASLIKKNKAILKKIALECTIIYIADNSSYAYDAFELLALDYLLNPISFERFEQSINKFIQFSLLNPLPLATIQKRLEPITESFFIKADIKGQKQILIKCNEVLYIEADQNYVFIYLTRQRKFLCHNTMKEMEESLPMSYFIRIHKSFIINYDQVTSIEGNYVVLDYNEKHKILIGNTYKKSFFERKNQKMIRKQRQFFSEDFYSSIA